MKRNVPRAPELAPACEPASEDARATLARARAGASQLKRSVGACCDELDALLAHDLCESAAVVRRVRMTRKSYRAALLHANDAAEPRAVRWVENDGETSEDSTARIHIEGDTAWRELDDELATHRKQRRMALARHLVSRFAAREQAAPQAHAAEPQSAMLAMQARAEGEYKALEAELAMRQTAWLQHERERLAALGLRPPTSTSPNPADPRGATDAIDGGWQRRRHAAERAAMDEVLQAEEQWHVARLSERLARRCASAVAALEGAGSTNNQIDDQVELVLSRLTAAAEAERADADARAAAERDARLGALMFAHRRSEARAATAMERLASAHRRRAAQADSRTALEAELRAELAIVASRVRAADDAAAAARAYRDNNAGTGSASERVCRRSARAAESAVSAAERRLSQLASDLLGADGTNAASGLATAASVVCAQHVLDDALADELGAHRRQYCDEVDVLKGKLDEEARALEQQLGCALLQARVRVGGAAAERSASAGAASGLWRVVGDKTKEATTGVSESPPPMSELLELEPSERRVLVTLSAQLRKLSLSALQMGTSARKASETALHETASELYGEVAEAIAALAQNLDDAVAQAADEAEKSDTHHEDVFDRARHEWARRLAPVKRVSEAESSAPVNATSTELEAAADAARAELAATRARLVALHHAHARECTELHAALSAKRLREEVALASWLARRHEEVHARAARSRSLCLLSMPYTGASPLPLCTAGRGHTRTRGRHRCGMDAVRRQTE